MPKGGLLFEEPTGLPSRTVDTKEPRHRVRNVGRILISLSVFFCFFFFWRSSGCDEALFLGSVFVGMGGGTRRRGPSGTVAIHFQEPR